VNSRWHFQKQFSMTFGKSPPSKMAGFQTPCTRLADGFRRSGRILNALSCIAALTIASTSLAYTFCGVPSGRSYKHILLPRAAGAGKEGRDNVRENLIDEFLDDDRLPGVQAAKVKKLQEAEATASDADADSIIQQAAFLDMGGIVEKWYNRATGAGVQLKAATFAAVLTAMVKDKAGVKAMEKWIVCAGDAGVAIAFEPILKAAALNPDPTVFRHVVTLRDKHSPKKPDNYGSAREAHLEKMLVASLVNKNFNNRHTN